MKAKQVLSSLMLVLTALIWGVAFVAQSAGMEHVGPFTFNGVRCIIGGLVLLPVTFVTGAVKSRAPQAAPAQPGPRRSVWLGGVLCGLVLFVASTLQQFGIMYTTVGKAGFITALYIIFVPIAGLIFKKRVSVLVWVAAVLAVGGMYLLCVTEGFSISLGDLLVLACAVGFTVHIMVIDHFSPFVDGVRMSCIQFFVAGILGLACMFIFEKPSFAALLDAWLPVLYAGVLSCGVAYTFQIIGQKHTPPTVASLLMSLESVFAVLAGWVLLGQQLSDREYIGCAVVFAAIILAQLPSPGRRKALPGQ